jgi:hypothetical protein
MLTLTLNQSETQLELRHKAKFQSSYLPKAGRGLDKNILLSIMSTSTSHSSALTHGHHYKNMI